MSERRVFQPNGIFGGKSGKSGKNILIKKDESFLNLGPKNSISVSPGDRFRILTPGAGGFGEPNNKQQSIEDNSQDFAEFN